jgi:uncharacterized protein (TIGR00255 family)
VSDHDAAGDVLSMTGFGRAEREGVALQVRVEARSVNARHLKVTCRAPSDLDARLHEIEALVKERVARGTVTITISLRRQQTAAPASIDAAVLADYAEQARAAIAHAGLSSEPPLEVLLRLPGVLTEPDEPELGDRGWETVAGTVGDALDALVAMRRREGAAMETILRTGADEIDRLAEAIRARVPDALVEHRQRLRDRLDALLEGAGGVPEELVAREAAVLSERTDVAEELERLVSHVAQWREALEAGGPVGRRLEFLTQELGREANTIGSKSADPAIRDAVIDLKLEIDRLKEQAANVE